MSLALCWRFLTKEHSPCLKVPTIGKRKCRLYIMHTLCLRRAVLGWCCLPLAKVTCPKCTCIGWSFLTLGQCKCLLLDSHTPWPMRAGLWWCNIPFSRVTFDIPTFHTRCVHALIMMSTIRGRHLPEAQKSWLMMSVVGWSQYYPPNAHMLYVMHSCLDDIVWHCPVSLSLCHKTHKMHENLGWYFMLFVDVT